jgi:GNAT superfamily N-acetyltransferase
MDRHVVPEEERMTAQGTGLHVRALRSGEEPALLAFLAQAYNERPGKSNPILWQWQFVRNPLMTAGEYLTRVCWDSDRIVGQLPLMPFNLVVGGKPFPASWMVDLIVRPEARGEGIGSKLIRSAMSMDRVHVGIGATRPALRIHNRAGATRFPDVKRFVFLHRPDPVAHRLSRLPVPRPLLRIAGGAAVAAHHLFVRKYTLRGVTMDALCRFDPEVDELFSREATGTLVVAERTSQFLNWRFSDSPGATYRILTARRLHQLVGYAVWRESLPGHCLIADIWAQGLRQDIFRAMITELVSRCQSLPDCECTECYATHKTLATALVSCGFLKHGGVSMNVYPATRGTDSGVLGQSRNWYVTALDSDIDPIFRFRTPPPTYR